MEEKIVKPLTSKQPQVQPQPAPQPSQNAPEPQPTTELDQTPQTDDSADMSIPEGYYRADPLFYEVAGYFQLNPEDYDTAKNELSSIVDWAILEGKSNKVEDILLNLRKLEGRLAPPTWGEKRYKVMYRYVRLAAQRQSIDKALESTLSGGIRP